MTRKMEWGCLLGKMEEFIKDNGLKASSMASEYIQMRVVTYLNIHI